MRPERRASVAERGARSARRISLADLRQGGCGERCDRAGTSASPLRGRTRQLIEVGVIAAAAAGRGVCCAWRRARRALRRRGCHDLVRCAEHRHSAARSDRGADGGCGPIRRRRTARTLHRRSKITWRSGRRVDLDAAGRRGARVSTAVNPGGDALGAGASRGQFLGFIEIVLGSSRRRGGAAVFASGRRRGDVLDGCHRAVMLGEASRGKRFIASRGRAMALAEHFREIDAGEIAASWRRRLWPARRRQTRGGAGREPPARCWWRRTGRWWGIVALANDMHRLIGRGAQEVLAIFAAEDGYVSPRVYYREQARRASPARDRPGTTRWCMCAAARVGLPRTTRGRSGRRWACGRARTNGG